MTNLPIPAAAKRFALAACVICLASVPSADAQSGEPAAIAGELAKSPLVKLGSTSLPSYPYGDLGRGGRGEFGYSMAHVGEQLWVSGAQKGGGVGFAAYDLDGRALGLIREGERSDNFKLLPVQGPQAACLAIRCIDPSVAGDSRVGLELAAYGEEGALVGEVQLGLESPPGLAMTLWGAVALGGIRDFALTAWPS